MPFWHVNGYLPLDPPLLAVHGDEVVVGVLAGEGQDLPAGDGGDDLVAGLDLRRRGGDLDAVRLRRDGLLGRERRILIRRFLGGQRRLLVCPLGGDSGLAANERGRQQQDGDERHP